MYGQSTKKKTVKTGLTDSQKDKLKKHKEHHTQAHMTMMRKLMREGMSFTKAHNQTMKNIGK